mgnify:CR=1 FL=1
MIPTTFLPAREYVIICCDGRGGTLPYTNLFGTTAIPWEYYLADYRYNTSCRSRLGAYTAKDKEKAKAKISLGFYHRYTLPAGSCVPFVRSFEAAGQCVVPNEDFFQQGPNET